MTIRKSKPVTIPADQIDFPFYVRRTLDEDRALYLAELYVAGTDLPPIYVAENKTTGRYDCIDGRHRHFAQVTLLDRTEVEVTIYPESERAALIMRAFTSNLGGSLPPTREDVRHVIRLLMESGKSRAQLYEMFVPKYYDRATLQRYLADIQSMQQKIKMTAAKQAVLNESKTLKEAAEHHGVDLDELKVALGGRKGKKDVNVIGTFKLNMSTIFRSCAQRHRVQMVKMVDAFQAGDLSKAGLRDAMAYLKRSVHQMQQTTDHWENRVRALTEKAKGDD